MENKIADKITSVSKNSPKELQNDKTEAGKARPKDVPKKKIHISRRETKNYWWIKVSITR